MNNTRIVAMIRHASASAMRWKVRNLRTMTEGRRYDADRKCQKVASRDPDAVSLATLTNILKECRSRVCRPPGACVCNEGYYRSNNGSCLLEDDCEYDNMDIIWFGRG
ncbi:hypothetical protein ANCDUO_02543 [Ancylostoma duodenale]|uniref:Trypsin Inhibitor like cysteine rich domain protein n=1 Tax=Ancylostoma duodenale TaxID=51022 RepID=A0A0C2H6H8_9BILA|nr:hypothetical protein ANCDUO_02543 [Ancylostoma duodenale]